MGKVDLGSSALKRTPFCRHSDSRRVVPVSGGCHGADQWTCTNVCAANFCHIMVSSMSSMALQAVCSSRAATLQTAAMLAGRNCV